jgi:IclR family pca regulon transcriptional regulator
MSPQQELRSAQPNSTTLQSLSRGLQVLSVVLAAPDGVSLTELAGAMGIHKATVLRLVRTLVEGGYVSADPRGPRYFPGPQILKYSVKTHMSAVAQAAGPFISELSAASRETVSLFVPAWPELVCCAALPSPEPIRRHREVGDSQPMTCASVGRAFLSHAPDGYVTAALEACPLERRTQHSVTDPDQFRSLLREARRQGYEISSEEVNLDMAGVAAPVLARGSALPLGVLSVSGPLFRWGLPQIKAFAPVLVDAARRLGQQTAADSVSPRWKEG